MNRIITLWVIILAIGFVNNLYADDSIIHIMKGAELQEEGKYVEAIAEYNKAVEINPGRIEVYGSIGYIYQYELHDYENAKEIYLNGLRHTPNDFDLNMNLMYLYFKTDKLDRGLMIYEKLSAMNKKKISYSFPETIVNKITQDMTLNEKIKFCLKYLDVNHLDLTLRSMLADLYYEVKHYKKSQKEYLSILKQQKESESGLIYFKLGVCEYYLNNFEAALSYLEKAKRLGQYVPKSYTKMMNKAILENRAK